MGTSEIEIVPLERSHLESATHIIAEAFVDEPGAVRIIGKSPEKRLPLLRKHFGMQAELSLAQGASRCALLNGELVGVMIISAPGEEAVSGFDMIRLLLRAMFKTSPGILWRGLKSSLEDEKNRPEESNCCLETIAVDPKHQGRGIGGALLAHLIEMSDAEGILTYLSTTDPKALPFYQRNGFEIVSETNGLGIPNHHMVRKPIPA